MPHKKEPANLSSVVLFFYRMFYFVMLAFLIGITIQTLLQVFGIVGFLVFYILVFVACVTVHEIGHLLGAILVKFYLSMFSVGFLSFIRIRDRWTIKLNRYILLGGFTLAAPLDDQHIDKRLVVWTIGGPLMGILYGLACFGLYLLLPPQMAEPEGVLSQNMFAILQAWFLANGCFSLLIAIHSLIPDQSWSATSDGYKLLQYWRNSEEARAMKYIYLISGAAQAGVRPRDWQPDYIEKLLQNSSTPNRRMQAFYYQYLYALDLGEIEKAGRSLDQALLLCRGKKLSSAGLYWEAAYFTARFRKQSDLARQWLRRAQAGLLDEAQTRARAEAAILNADGYKEEALSWIEKGLLVVADSIEPGIAIAERDWLDDLKTLVFQDFSQEELSPQVQVRRMISQSLDARDIDSKVVKSEQRLPESIPSARRRPQKIQIDSLWKILILGTVPVLVFSVVLAVLYYWMQPPSCAPKIIDNFLCKSSYNMAVFQGLNAEKQGDHRSAVQAFSLALEAHPDGLLARNMRAHLSKILGDYPQAMVDLSFLIDRNQSDPSLYLTRAEIWMRQGRLLLALDDAVTAISIDPDQLEPNGRKLLQQIFEPIEDFDQFFQDLHAQEASKSDELRIACKLGLAYAYDAHSTEAEKYAQELALDSSGSLKWCSQEIRNITDN